MMFNILSLEHSFLMGDVKNAKRHAKSICTYMQVGWHQLKSWRSSAPWLWLIGLLFSTIGPFSRNRDILRGQLVKEDGGMRSFFKWCDLSMLGAFYYYAGGAVSRISAPDQAVKVLDEGCTRIERMSFLRSTKTVGCA